MKFLTLITISCFITALSINTMANAAKLATSIAGQSSAINGGDQTAELQSLNDSTSNQLKQNIPNKERNLADNLQQLHHSDYSFTIYQAATELINDYDADGYYQAFRITFDADLLSYQQYQQAHVYAELYLSYNGGPWQHYLTTDIFTLYDDSSDDKYSIYTRLNQGYSAGSYDVLIDLYEVGFSDIVASYSGFDDAAIATLPLESNEFDNDYVTEVEQVHTDIHYHGGSTSLLLTVMLMLLLIGRRLTTQVNSNNTE